MRRDHRGKGHVHLSTARRLSARRAVVVGICCLTACKDATRSRDVPRPIDPVLNANIIVSNSAPSLAYVSLPPGTIADGVTAAIANRRSGAVAMATLVNGGFDPVPIPAVVGDTMDVSVTRQIGGSAWGLVVLSIRRPPRVVRTNPPHGQTDVPVNRTILVVFSEPVAAASVTPTSLHLAAGTTAVEGSVAMNGFNAEFRPNAPLAFLAQHTLTVERTITAIAGLALESAVTASFTTCPNYAIPWNCPRFSTTGARDVSGVVTELTADGRRPVAGVQVFPWVQMGTGAGFRMRPMLTDSTGAFRYSNVPDGSLWFEAVKAGFDQPCAAVASTIGQNATVSFDVVSSSRPLPALASTPYSISGVVFETTPNGRKPVSAVKVGFDMGGGLYVFGTTTDDAGRYSLCGFLRSWSGDVFTVKAPYTMTLVPVSLSSGSVVLDLELKR